jgi:uncharacterized membrane protein YphA (DoxX/SURF4 family)
MAQGSGLRRLYSTFAGSWPGAGLLLLRLLVGSFLLAGAGPKPWSEQPLDATLTSTFLAGSALLLVAGLWTPVAGAIVALIELSQILTVTREPWVCFLAGGISGALAMLGPGRWSVDAQLFGWKRIEAPPRQTRSNGL